MSVNVGALLAVGSERGQRGIPGPDDPVPAVKAGRAGSGPLWSAPAQEGWPPAGPPPRPWATFPDPVRIFRPQGDPFSPRVHGVPGFLPRKTEGLELCAELSLRPLELSCWEGGAGGTVRREILRQEPLGLPLPHARRRPRWPGVPRHRF